MSLLSSFCRANFFENFIFHYKYFMMSWNIKSSIENILNFLSNIFGWILLFCTFVLYYMLREYFGECLVRLPLNFLQIILCSSTYVLYIFKFLHLIIKVCEFRLSISGLLSVIYIFDKICTLLSMYYTYKLETIGINLIIVHRINIKLFYFY